MVGTTTILEDEMNLRINKFARADTSKVLAQVLRIRFPSYSYEQNFKITVRQVSDPEDEWIGSENQENDSDSFNVVLWEPYQFGQMFKDG